MGQASSGVGAGLLKPVSDKALASRLFIRNAGRAKTKSKVKKALLSDKALVSRLFIRNAGRAKKKSKVKKAPLYQNWQKVKKALVKKALLDDTLALTEPAPVPKAEDYAERQAFVCPKKAFQLR